MSRKFFLTVIIVRNLPVLQILNPGPGKAAQIVSKNLQGRLYAPEQMLSESPFVTCQTGLRSLHKLCPVKFQCSLLLSD